MGDENYWISGKIYSIGNDFITINYGSDEIKINKITAVKTLRTDCNYKNNGSQLIGAGIIAPTIPITNGLINGDRPIITKGYLITSAGIILTGLMINSLAIKVHKIGKRKKLIIV